MNKWKQIWNKNERINKIILEMLIKADGFDSGAGSFSVDNWIEYTHLFYKKLNIQKNDSIYDVGCGSGAFIYPLYLEKHFVGGIDYSMGLIDLAHTIMPNSDFVDNEAIYMDVSKSYDVVVSHSVFHYFKDLSYAKSVIEKMINKSNKKIAIFDINDKSKESEYHKIRMQGMDEKEYKDKYKGLGHMFYEKTCFVDLANEFGCIVDIFDQDFEKFSNSKLRFNVIMEKK